MDIILQLHVTGKCNLRCKHCYIEEYGAEMDFADICRCLCQFDELIEHLSVKEPVLAHLHMTGGEPFLHSDIDRILELLRQKQYWIGIMTNGSCLTTERVKQLKSLPLKAVQLSLDGTEQTHNFLRGAGNYMMVLQAMDLLWKYKVPCRIAFTANADNYHEFPRVAQICRRHHVASLWSDRYIPFHENGIRPILAEEMKEYSAVLRTEKKRLINKICGLRVENRRALQFLCSQDMPYFCTAAENLVTVDEHGDIFPCRRLPIACGNIKTATITEIYENNSLFQMLRRHSLEGKCKKCEYGQNCKGGARCFAYALTGEINVPDPGCPLEF